MSSTKSYFDKHSHHHPYVKDPKFYQSIISKMEGTRDKDQIDVLDLGCGNGSFIEGLIARGIKGTFIGVDVSDNMIKQARDNLAVSTGVHLFVADGFNLPISYKTKFDLIHLDSVLHHLIGKNRKQSITLVDNLLRPLAGRLTENGILVIEEIYYVSHIIPYFTSYLIFYGLKLMNSLHVDISKIRGEFQPGLEVNFFTQEQIESLLRRYGIVKQLRKQSWQRIPLMYRFFLLKDAGHITYTVESHHVSKY